MVKKILFISQYFYPENFKGNDLVFELSNRGYEVVVITGKPNYPLGRFFEGYGIFKKKFEIIQGVSVYRLPIVPRGNGNSILLILNYFSFFISSFIFYRFHFLKEEYDVIITQQLSPITSSLPGLWYKKRRNVKLITWVLDLWPESLISTTQIKKGIIIRFIEKLSKSLYINSDTLLVSSNSFIDPLIKKGVISKSRIKYFPNWAEEIFEKKIITKLFPNLPSGFNIVYAGNFGEAQDFQNIIKAIELIKDSKDINFIFVGGGRFEVELVLLIQKLQINNVFLFKQYSVEFMPSLFSMSDALLLTLKGGSGISNTVPAKLQTYLASSKPILAMIDGEAKTILTNANCGFIADAGDYFTLSQNILKMKRMQYSERLELGKNGRKFYDGNFSRELIIKRFIGELN